MALRRGGLRRRLVLAFGAFAMTLIAATLLPLGFVINGSHFSEYTSRLERQARSAVPELGDTLQAPAVLAGRFPVGGEVHALLLSRLGQALTLPRDPGAFPPVALESREVRVALGGQAASRATTLADERRVLVAAPVARGGRVSAVLWLSAPLGPVDDLNGRTWAALGTIGAAAIVLAIVVAMAVSRQIARRLEMVAAGAERFAEGRLAEPIRVRGDDEIAQLGSRLNEMAVRIERSVAVERDFVSAASHQLRTPLTAIKIRLEELGVLTGGDATAHEYVDEMTQEVDRLTNIASGLLRLAEVEGAPEPEAVPAHEAVAQAIDRLRPLARKQEVELVLEDRAAGVAVVAPEGAFQEVVFNVLDNAVKYSSPGTKVEISLDREEGLLVVTAADRGAGVTQEEARRAFEPFYRARRLRSASGSGLGLAIGARLCRAAGATISLAPRPDGGTLAEIRWPIARPESHGVG